MAAEVRMEANWVETRARLTMGDDAGAATVAEQVGRLTVFHSTAFAAGWATAPTPPPLAEQILGLPVQQSRTRLL